MTPIYLVIVESLHHFIRLLDHSICQKVVAVSMFKSIYWWKKHVSQHPDSQSGTVNKHDHRLQSLASSCALDLQLPPEIPKIPWLLIVWVVQKHVGDTESLHLLRNVRSWYVDASKIHLCCSFPLFIMVSLRDFTGKKSCGKGHAMKNETNGHHT